MNTCHRKGTIKVHAYSVEKGTERKRREGVRVGREMNGKGGS